MQVVVPESLIRFAADSAEALISYVDRDLRYVYANRKYQEWFGVSIENIRGRTIKEVLGEEAYNVVLPYVTKALAGETVHFETELTYGDRARRWISGSYVPDIEASGEVAGFAGFAVDITQRRDDELAQQFLARAEVTLSESLDYEQTLQKVAELAVTSLADWCAVSVFEGQGQAKRVALAHRDPSRIRWAQEMERKYPQEEDPEGADAVVRRTGEPIVLSEVPEDLINKAARDEEHLALLREAAIHSALVVPMKSSEGVIGLISLVSSHSGRYGDPELRFAEQLASRASLAIQNSRLYQQLRIELGERVEAEQRFKSVVNSSLDAVITINSEHLVQLWDGSAEEMFGFSSAEALGKPLYDLVIPPEYRQAHIEGMAEYLRTGEAPILNKRIEIVAQRKGGERFPVELQISKISGTAGVTFSAFVRDVTDEKEAERALRESEARFQTLAADLDQRVQERTRELEAFSYSVSHDLRAPLRTISAFSRMLIEDQRELLDAEGKANLDRIVEASGRMSNLIDDLLQYARVTRVEMNITRVDLTALAEEIVADLRRKYPERRVDVDVHPRMHVMADLNLMRVAMENLIDNAWKYTSKTRRACIEVGCEPGEKVVYFVRDNGAGFDMKYANKLFKVFERLHGDYDFPGTGIGLTNVQRIINRLGGKVWCYAEPNNGATFYFTLNSPTGG